MKKLLLLDADVIIDLHTLGLFEKMTKAYNIEVTLPVLREAKFYKLGQKRISIDIRNQVNVIENIEIDSLQEIQEKAKRAMLVIDPGEATSIAYLIQSQRSTFCSCDKAAIILISFMDLESRSISLEKALRDVGHHTRLYPRHLESNFKECIREGKILKIQRTEFI